MARKKPGKKPSVSWQPPPVDPVASAMAESRALLDQVDAAIERRRQTLQKERKSGATDEQRRNLRSLDGLRTIAECYLRPDTALAFLAAGTLMTAMLETQYLHFEPDIKRSRKVLEGSAKGGRNRAAGDKFALADKLDEIRPTYRTLKNRVPRLSDRSIAANIAKKHRLNEHTVRGWIRRGRRELILD